MCIAPLLKLGLHKKTAVILSFLRRDGVGVFHWWVFLVGRIFIHKILEALATGQFVNPVNSTPFSTVGCHW